MAPWIRISYYLYLSLCLWGTINAQGMQDSLAKYSYLELENLIYAEESDTMRIHVYMNYYLQKAKKEKNIGRIAIYYRNFVFYKKAEIRLSQIDSALHYAYQTKDKALIGSVYLTRATVYYSIKDYGNTLDNYLKANNYIVQTDDTYNKYRVKNHIAGLKNYLGYYKDAEELFAECINYFGKDETNYNMHRGYINSLLGLAWSYTKTGRITESQNILSKTLASAQKAGFEDLDLHYTIFKQGINHYLLGEYDSAIYKIEKQLPILYSNEDFAWASIGESYVGRSYWDKGDKVRAVSYFKKIDSVFDTKNYTHPDVRNAYEHLIDYHKAQRDKDGQIKYISQLVKVDSVFNQSHRYLLSRIHKEYTTKDLIDAKIGLEADLYLQKNKTMLIAGGSSLILLLVGGWIYYRNRRAKRIVSELICKIKSLQEQLPTTVIAVHKSEISERIPGQMKDEVIEQVMRKLDIFEQKRKFLKPDITLEKLADNFGINKTYLSQVINTHKKRTFPEYINSLRIDYLMSEMVNNKESILFKYSIKSLAEHLGYKSADVFSRVFVAHTTVKPSTFIKEVLIKHTLPVKMVVHKKIDLATSDFR